MKENGVEYRCNELEKITFFIEKKKKEKKKKKSNEDITSESICNMLPLDFLVDFNSTKDWFTIEAGENDS